MQEFVKKIEDSQYQIEFLVDGKIFDEDTILKAAYELVDKVYPFFRKSGDDYIVQFKLKDKTKNIEDIVDSFGEELVYHRLRRDIDQKTGDTKQKIIETALGYGLSLSEIKKDIYDLSMAGMEEQTQADAEPESRSVDDIISDIQNDPEFAEDKDEIISILKEINS